MTSIDIANVALFAGSMMILLGIFSSLIAKRFGAPLVLVFLVLGMLLGQDGPGGIAFDNPASLATFSTSSGLFMRSSPPRPTGRPRLTAS